MRARQLYGLTEAGSVACDLAPIDHVDPATVGRPLGTVVVTIEDQAGHALPPASSARSSYAAPPSKAVRRARSGRATSAASTPSGPLTITGRTSLFINTAGNKVDPAEVEAAPAGPSRRRRGRRLRARRRARRASGRGRRRAREPGRAADALRAHCRELLAPHKIPRVLTFRDALPRSPLGKVLIGRLLAEA